MRISKAFVRIGRPAKPRARLLVFHYAGGSASLFRPWAQQLPDDLEILAGELPGRAARFNEPPLREVSLAVEMFANETRHWSCDVPYVFFGHSLGALVAYELAHFNRRHALITPRMLVVSGKKAPHMPRIDPTLADLPREEFKQRLREYDGTPDEILQNAEFVDLLLPMLRCDFAMVENYSYTPRDAIECPIFALGGRSDRWVSEEEIRGWQFHTASDFGWSMLDGGHFFIRSRGQEVLAILRKLIGRVLAEGRPGLRE